MQKVILRPHHINCIFFFEGKGYSEEFVSNMRNVINILTNNNVIIKFQTNCDDICAKCPKKINNLCIDYDHIDLLDKLTIKNYNLDLNKEYLFKDLIELFYKNFSSDKFQKICNSCEWYKSGVCSISKIEENKKKFKY